ncbi:MAG: zinc-dependent metalloprotease, partial [Chitinophagales bacterium]
ISGTPVERADGSNCENSGDGFCDTPPDYISDRWQCNFDRTFRDPAGNTFIVDKNNFMSYSADGCSNYLKDDQLAEVNAAAANHRPYLLNLPIPDLSPLDAITNIAPSGITQNLSPSNLSLSWNAVEGAEYYYIEATVGTFFNPILEVIVTDTFYTFNALTNRDYQWRVRPISLLNTCTDFSPIQTFSTARYSADLTSTDISCTGFFDGSASVSLNTSGSLQYYWTSADPLVNANLQFEGGTSVSNLAQGEYTLYVLRNGVDSLALPFTIGNGGISSVNLNLVNNTIVAQISGGQAPYDVIWSNGETGLTLNNPIIGNNIIQVTDQNGCQKTESILFTAINSIEDKIEISSVFPNPNQGNMINLQANFKEALQVDMAIIDLSGRILMKENISTSKGNNVLSFDVNQLSNGIYFFQVQYQGAQVSKRFVINR